MANFEQAVQVSFGLASFIMIYLGLNYGDMSIFNSERKYPVVKIFFVGLGLGMLLLMMNSSYNIAANNNTTVYTNNVVNSVMLGSEVMTWTLYLFLIFGFLMLIFAVLADVRDLVKRRKK